MWHLATRTNEKPTFSAIVRQRTEDRPNERTRFVVAFDFDPACPVKRGRAGWFAVGCDSNSFLYRVIRGASPNQQVWNPPGVVQNLRKSKASEAASLMGKLNYAARVERLGIERILEIARENGKKGGRPPKKGK